jgi:hypothetical protein
MQSRSTLVGAALAAAITALTPAAATAKPKSGFKTSKPPMLQSSRARASLRS